MSALNLSLNMMPEQVCFVLSPRQLPSTKGLGKTVLLDIAFAFEGEFGAVTSPFIRALGRRLVGWIDHHPHPQWKDFLDDPRFILVDKRDAPACPELITKARISQFGQVDNLLVHADFDGCISAAKYLLGGRSPYLEADEDARAVDAPGRGYHCSKKGERLAMAMDEGRSSYKSKRYKKFLGDLLTGLVDDYWPARVTQEIETLEAAQIARRERLLPLLENIESPHKEIALLRFNKPNQISDRKTLMRWLEERARVGLIVEPEQLTIATYDIDRLDLTVLSPLRGGRGYVWGKSRIEAVLPRLLSLLG